MTDDKKSGPNARPACGCPLDVCHTAECVDRQLAVAADPFCPRDATSEQLAKWGAGLNASPAPPQWFGVWCERDGEPGFWRGVGSKLEPLQTTYTEAERTAKVLNDGAKKRKDSLGWRYAARPYVPAAPSSGVDGFDQARLEQWSLTVDRICRWLDTTGNGELAKAVFEQFRPTPDRMRAEMASPFTRPDPKGGT